jgi:hypothetical protein
MRFRKTLKLLEHKAAQLVATSFELMPMPDLKRWTVQELASLATLPRCGDERLESLSVVDLERMARGERVEGFDYSIPPPRADPKSAREMDRICKRVAERLRLEDARGTKCEV